MDLTNIHRILHSKTKEYTFYLATHGSFSKIDHILGYKTNLYEYKKMEITPHILPDHKAIKLRTDNK